jgi:hypothetical protein
LTRVSAGNPEARAAGRALVAEGKAAGPHRQTFAFANNRLEGDAISAIAEMAGSGISPTARQGCPS